MQHCTKRYLCLCFCRSSADLSSVKLSIGSQACPLFPRKAVAAMRRKADDASLPPTGDQLPVDPRPNKVIPQPEKTRFILVHNLPIEGRDDGITSVRFEVPADGIIDDLKQAISESLTNSRLYLPRRAFFLKLREIHQPYFTLLKNIEPTAELSIQWSQTSCTSVPCEFEQ